MPSVGFAGVVCPMAAAAASQQPAASDKTANGQPADANNEDDFCRFDLRTRIQLLQLKLCPKAAGPLEASRSHQQAIRTDSIDGGGGERQQRQPDDSRSIGSDSSSASSAGSAWSSGGAPTPPPRRSSLASSAGWRAAADGHANCSPAGSFQPPQVATNLGKKGDQLTAGSFDMHASERCQDRLRLAPPTVATTDTKRTSSKGLANDEPSQAIQQDGNLLSHQAKHKHHHHHHHPHLNRQHPSSAQNNHQPDVRRSPLSLVFRPAAGQVECLEAASFDATPLGELGPLGCRQGAEAAAAKLKGMNEIAQNDSREETTTTTTTTFGQKQQCPSDRTKSGPVDNQVHPADGGAHQDARTATAAAVIATDHNYHPLGLQVPASRQEAGSAPPTGWQAAGMQQRQRVENNFLKLNHANQSVGPVAGRAPSLRLADQVAGNQLAGVGAAPDALTEAIASRHRLVAGSCNNLSSLATATARRPDDKTTPLAASQSSCTQRQPATAGPPQQQQHATGASYSQQRVERQLAREGQQQQQHQRPLVVPPALGAMPAPNSGARDFVANGLEHSRQQAPLRPLVAERLFSGPPVPAGVQVDFATGPFGRPAPLASPLTKAIKEQQLNKLQQQKQQRQQQQLLMQPGQSTGGGGYGARPLPPLPATPPPRPNSKKPSSRQSLLGSISSASMSSISSSNSFTTTANSSSQSNTNANSPILNATAGRPPPLVQQPPANSMHFNAMQAQQQQQTPQAHQQQQVSLVSNDTSFVCGATLFAADCLRLTAFGVARWRPRSRERVRARLATRARTHAHLATCERPDSLAARTELAATHKTAFD
jgi:hypothetical protein